MIKNFVKQVALYGAGDLFFRLLNFAVFPIYAHLFSLADFGVITLVTTLAGLVSIFINCGINNAVSRYYWDPSIPNEKRRELTATGLMMILAIATVFTLTTIALLWPFHNFLEERFHLHWNWILLGLAANIPTQLLQYSQDTLRLHFAPFKFLCVAACKSLLGVVVSLILIVVGGWGLSGYFWGNMLGAAAAVPLALFLIRNDIGLWWNTALAKRLLHFGYPFIFVGLAFWVFGSLDRWMLGWLNQTEEVGRYAIAFKFAMAITFLDTAFGKAWTPFAMKLYGEDVHYKKVYSQVFSFWILLLALVGGSIALFAPELLFMLTPEEYWTAATITAVIAVGAALDGTTQMTAIGITLEKKTHLLSHGAWLSAFLNVILNYLLIPSYGAQGAAFATLASYLLLTGGYLFWTQRLHPLPLQWKTIGFSLLALAASLGLAFLFQKQNWSIWHCVYKAGFLMGVGGIGIALNRNALNSIKSFAIISANQTK